MKVLFVCSANLCRSPLAENILKDMLHKKGISEVKVESAGIHDYSGMPFDYTMVSYARKEGYELSGCSKCLTQSIADAADLIICMESFHVVELQRRFVPYARWHCIHRFNEICFDEQSDLMDPSGDSGYMYSVVLEKIQEGIRNLVWKIERKIRYGDNFLSDTTNYGLN